MIVILAPYGRTETTSAAIRVADLALSVGADVRFVAIGDHEHNVHPYWDSMVVSGRGDGVYKAAIKSGTVVHFQLGPRLWDRVSLVSELSRQVLVVPWHAIQPNDVAAIRSYSLVVCPSHACYNAVLKLLSGTVSPKLLAKQVTWARFDSGVTDSACRQHDPQSPLRACFVATGSVVDGLGSQLLYTIEQLLERVPLLSASLLWYKVWPEHDRRTVKRMLQRFGSRLQYVRGVSGDRLATAFHESDWVVLPMPKADFNVTATRALGCGNPVIGFDMAPLNETIKHNHNGLLVPCDETYRTLCGAAVVVPNVPKLLQTCIDAFTDSFLLTRLHRNDWDLKRSAIAFDRFWLKHLGLEGE